MTVRFADDTQVPVAPTVAEVFDAILARDPDAVAVVSRGRQITYRALAASVSSVAERLPAEVGPGTVVGVRHRDGLRRVTAMLAVIRRAAAVLPIDPDYPEPRVRAMAASAGARLICAEESDDSQPDDGVSGAACARVPAPSQTSASLVYVVSTSGSTGTPKAVGVPHGALLNLLTWSAAEYQLSPDDRLLPTHAPAFDASMREILLPLLGGATLVLGEGDERFRPAALLDLVANERVTLLDMVPSLLSHVLGEPHAAQALRTVRAVTCGGEALPAALADRLTRTAPWVRLYNQYGPTEATIAVSSWCCPAGAGIVDAEPPIGHAVHGVSLHLLDEAMQPVKDGQAGELFIGGAAIARGYLGRPDLTAERFIPDPFGSAGQRLYQTGDLARRRADGQLEFVGRADDQVKIGGHRVEPGEVAAVLRAHPGLSDAAVVPVEAEGERQALAAYVVPCSPADRPGTTDLRRWLADRLPWFMVPAHIMTMKRLPRTGTGKLDRKALPTPQTDTGHGTADTELHRVIHEAVCAVLGSEDIDGCTDFFAAGADSLQIHRIAANLARRLGVEIPVRVALGHRSIDGLAEVLAAAEPRQSMPPAPAGDRPALSFGQERLWFLDQLAPGSAAYNICAAYRVIGPLDARRLTAALRAVCERHELLRAFVVRTPQQLRFDLLSARAVVPDLVPRPVPDLDAELRELTRKPFDLAVGPLLRADLLVDGADHVLVIVAHHLVFDGLSIGPFQDDLAQAYRALGGTGATTALGQASARPAAYGDFVREQRTALTDARMSELFGFWTRQLSGVDLALELPRDRARGPVPTYRADAVPVRLPPATSRALRTLARASSASLHTACLAVFQVVLARLAGRERFVVGCPAAGRRRAAFQDTIGFFVNTLAIVAEPKPELAFTGLLADVRDATRAALDHEDLPFERLVERLAPNRELDRNPIVQVWFDLFSRPPSVDLDPGTTTLARATVPVVATRFDLELHLEPTEDDGVAGELVFATDQFDRSTALLFAGCFERVAQQCAAFPEAAVGSVDLLTPETLDTVLRRWNATDASSDDLPAQPSSVAKLFDAAVDAAPGAVALYDGQEAISFQSLRDRARRLARFVQRRVPDARAADRSGAVAFALPHGLDAVVALLAIVMAGRPYLAIDVETPPERAAFMLSNARASLVLSRSDCDAAVATARDVLHLDAVSDAIAAETADPLATSAGLDDLLYIMYTSGSTGQPKAVAMTHRPLLNLLAWQRRRARLTGPTLQFSALNFDISFQEMFATWAAGLPVVLLDRDQRRDPERMLSVMRERSVSTLFCPPLVLEGIAQAAHGGGLLPPLDYIVTAGDVLHMSEPVRALLARLPGVRLDNQYGPTEAHVITGELLSGDQERWPRFPLVGRPVTGCAVYLLDCRGRMVPPRVAGELYVGGVCLANGYLNRADLTAERFVPDPFGPAGSRLYRTGDLARWTVDGRVEFLGRVDHQVKIRGYRIEPSEIEAVLAAAPEVADAAVIAMGDGADRRLVAFVAPSSGADALDEGDEGLEPTLRARLQVSLPTYMVPASIVAVPSLPLTAAGKLDRKALTSLAELGSGSRPAVRVMPASPHQKIVAEIWARCLGTAPIGLDEDFFEIGGHSLLATRVLNEVREAFQVALPLRAVFEHRSVRALADAIESAVLDEIAALTDEDVAAALPDRRTTTEEEEHAHHQRH